MKPLGSLVGAISLITVTLFSCRTETPVKPIDDTVHYTPSDSAIQYFLSDATDFAVEHLFTTMSPDTSQVIVPDSVLNKYLLPLACLYDKRHEIPLLDTLLVQMQIHKEIISCLGTVIKADTNYEWVQNVRKGISPTGDVTVDSLVQLYNLEFTPIYGWGFQGFARIGTRQSPMNSYALGHAFRSAPGVISTQPDYMTHYSSRLIIVLSASEATIYLYKGYGDCPAGCFGYDRWTFSVSDKFEVNYLGYLHM
jgi:hypothetical protein